LINYILVGGVALIVGLILGTIIRKYVAESKIKSAEAEARRIIEEGIKDSETKKKEAIIEAKDEIHKMRNETERENKERRNELKKLETRLLKKEETLDKKSEINEQREENLNKRRKKIETREKQIEEIEERQRVELEKISGLSSEEAKNMLLDGIKKDVEHESAILVKEIERNAKDTADRKAREVISYAIQKCAADHVAETTVSVVDLPNDEMKGRIIGREGRNIRALETMTGIDLIIDDTPEAVVISGFDPIRREVARIALEKLINDGRIHPARIEEMVDRAKKEIDIEIKEEGEKAAFDTGVNGIHPEIIKLLGRLKYRTSYGQNVLKHSIEVAYLSSIMAAELGADVRLAKRAGLLHDIGKAVDHEIEGPHVTIGADMAKRYRESKDVVNAIAAHHNDIEPSTIEAVLVQAADAISAARPGARRETLESYIKRLEKLEDIANSFDGVDKCYAIQAGREVRIMVKPEKVNDSGMVMVSRDIVKRIEAELEYPGQIKVNVIRETRSVSYAK